MSYYLTEVLKIGRFYQLTSVTISYIYREYAYCVLFPGSCMWFNERDEAVKFHIDLCEYYFFKNETRINTIKIKEYIIS
jgi:hypothetical protein